VPRQSDDDYGHGDNANDQGGDSGPEGPFQVPLRSFVASFASDFFFSKPAKGELTFRLFKKIMSATDDIVSNGFIRCSPSRFLIGVGHASRLHGHHEQRTWRLLGCICGSISKPEIMNRAMMVRANDKEIRIKFAGLFKNRCQRRPLNR